MSLNRALTALVLGAAGLLSVSGCRRTAPAGGESPAALSGNVQVYQLKGVVVSTSPSTGEVSVDSEEIPGFMGAMIMPYKLAQPNIAGELHSGDHIVARLRVSDTGAALLDRIVVTAQARPDYKPKMVYNVLKPGEPVPDFHFLNQSGRTIRLEQFRGKALLITFVYTRCPLPDYCIRMSRNFAQIDRELAADPSLYRRTHLLSISFDPEHDTPKVLRAYGEEYAGKSAPGAFAHWDFAAAPTAELPDVEKFFDVGVSPGADGTLTHSLSTVAIAPDGTVFHWYPTNDWSPEDAIRQLQLSLGQASGPA